MTRLSRRQLFAGLTAGTAVALVPMASQASQPHMEAALDALRTAERELKNATNDKGGYRGKAIQLVKNAIVQVESGIEWAKKH
jgi:hypothetical protein